MLEFDANGLLPPGVHLCDWDEFARRFGWNAPRRRLLVGLGRALKALRVAGCEQVYVDGSFVTARERPNDFDACWDTRNVDPEKLDPVLLTFGVQRLAQKAKYFGEMFPAAFTAETSTGRTYLEFFQTDKDTG